MRQASGHHWSLRSSEEHERRAALATRLGLSELSPEPGSVSILPPPHELELQPFSIRSLPRARLESYTRTRIGHPSSRHQHQLELNHAPPSSSSEVEPDEFHDCSMDLEDNSASFSNMFDDLDLEGSEMFHEEHAGGAATGAGPLMIQPDIGSGSSSSRGPIFDPVASTGNNSRAFSCKRKSYSNLPASNPPHFQHSDVHQPGLDFSRRAALVLPPPSLGASSSRSMEGPRPQKTRLSSDYSSPDSSLRDSIFPSPPRRDFSSSNSGDGGAQAPQPYPRALRRSFPHAQEVYRARRAAMLEFPESASFAQLASREVSSPGSGTPFGSVRSPRFHPSSGSSGAGQGISRRIGRINSSRSLASNPSQASQQGEMRTRSMRMAFLESGALAGQAPGLRREPGANILAGGGASSRHHHQHHHHHLLHPESRPGYASGRSSLFSCPPGGISASSPIALMEPPELRSPPVFDGSQGSLRHPGLNMSRRELAEGGFMGIPHEFDWEHHRPRFMAGGLAEILRALERVERDEDLTREQLMMLEATTFLFGGIGLHDDHSDWRLDIDNMSYEELLALGDRIGTVSTGLTEESITQKLKKSMFSSALARSTGEDSDVKCCICQEEFEEGVELGKIDCGHRYHTDCIGQWLVQKNSCPICKATGLS